MGDFLKKRDEEGSYNMVRELAMGDREMYFRYKRMKWSTCFFWSFLT